MPRSFVWRYLWHRARREIVVLFGPTPRFTGMALSPRRQAPGHDRRQAGLRALGCRFRRSNSRHGESRPVRLASPTFSADGSLIAAEDRDADSAPPRRLFGLGCRLGPSAGSICRWTRASSRSRALSCRRDVLLGSGHHDTFGSPPRTRLWSLAGDPSQPTLLGQYRSASWTWIPPRPVAGSSRSIVQPSITLRDIRTGKPTREFHVEPATEHITAWASSPGAEIVAAVSEPSWKLHLWDGHYGKIAGDVIPLPGTSTG